MTIFKKESRDLVSMTWPALHLIESSVGGSYHVPQAWLLGPPTSLGGMESQSWWFVGMNYSSSYSRLQIVSLCTTVSKFRPSSHKEIRSCRVLTRRIKAYRSCIAMHLQVALNIQDIQLSHHICYCHRRLSVFMSSLHPLSQMGRRIPAAEVLRRDAR